MRGKKTVLMILDGWGHGDRTKSDAIHHANTPFIDSLYLSYPNTELQTDGLAVGLPEGQMGNSEVGHLNIGAGRIVYQDLAKINKACAEKTLEDMPKLQASFQYAIDNNKPLHLMGLVSDGGIHSHSSHLFELCRLAQKAGVKEVYVHAFTDGRDTDPKSGKQFLEELESNLHGARIASICGRYYSMDRDNRWERVKLAYDLLVKGEGQNFNSVSESIQASYDNGVTDEFIKPIALTENDKSIATIKEGDAVICFNFRTDRCREITTALTQKEMPEYGMQTLNLHYTTMTMYDKNFKDVNIIFEKDNLHNTLGQVVAENGLKQIRIAETEKYPHVTFFFSGGREAEFEGEKRLMASSPKVATYDLQPEMSAHEVVAKIVPELEQATADFVCLNFANPDMVGHTGDYDAIVKAVETVDQCTKEVVEAGLKNDYAFIIIADHGNADFAVNQDGSPNTAHTTNPVPCFLLNTEHTSIKKGKLGDIAPTLLTLMGIAIPQEMTGETLV
ncbi:2,3-bisphosphoglycerate-independent phosphoglycerate mutase [Flavobacteriales bacterium]|nr:2,3-bisphosphoglycerate-independent phosphoglycerate mutase [Flavobacteriales bacterium]